jgi:general secretion pathway protein K
MTMRSGISSLSGNSGRSERGIALILVLWVITLLAVIAGSFVYGARNAALSTGNQVSIARARALADAGIHRGIYELSKPTSDGARWKADGKTNTFSLDDGEIRLVMRDETARIDLNTASDALLKGLLLSAGLDEEEANKVLDAILDWRDADDLVRPQGAERDQYEAQGLPYIPANAPFQTVAELQSVIGITPELYRKLADALTVFSRAPGINSTIAPRQVLLALPNVTEENVDAYLAEREEMLAAGQLPLAFPQAAGFETGAASEVYNLRSVSKAADGTQYVREAVVKLGQDPKRPFIIYLWQEGRL